jgi:hypothetical protein
MPDCLEVGLYSLILVRRNENAPLGSKTIGTFDMMVVRVLWTSLQFVRCPPWSTTTCPTLRRRTKGPNTGIACQMALITISPIQTWAKLAILTRVAYSSHQETSQRLSHLDGSFAPRLTKCM